MHNILKSGFTIIEFSIAIFVLSAPVLIGEFVARRAGIGAGIFSAICAGLAISTFVYWMMFAISGEAEKERHIFEERYNSIFRLLEVPPDRSAMTAVNAVDIEVDDFGWEAEPLSDDGQIYLQGLTKEWQVVWYAGFVACQVERIGRKPRSQYYLPYKWISGEEEAPPCPYPVKNEKLETFGYPVRRGVDEKMQHYLIAGSQTRTKRFKF
jgi:hypothetical protein